MNPQIITKRPVIWAFVLVAFVSCAFFVLWGVGDQVLGDAGAQALPVLRWALMVPIALIATLAGVRSRPAVLAQLIFLVTVGITWILDPDPYASFLIWFRILAAFGVARGAALLTDQQRGMLVNYLIFILATMVVLSAVLGLKHVSAAYSGGDFGMEGDRVRVRGVFFHPGILGYGAAIAFAYGFSRLTSAQVTVWMRLTWIGVMSCAFYDLIQSDSRTGQIATCASVGLIIAYNAIAASFRNRSVGRLAAVFLMVGTLAMIAAPLCVALGVLGEVDTSGARGNSNAMRMALWSSGWSNFLAQPVKGIGVGALLSVRASTVLAETDLPYYHSVLVNYLAKTGVIGTFGLLALIFTSQFRVFMAMTDPAVAPRGTLNRKVVIFSAISTLITLVSASVEGELQGSYISFEIFFLASALLPSSQPSQKLSELGGQE